MKITGKENEKAILKELGQRIKHHRISRGFTQAELADRCGISPSTEARIESGADTVFSNYIKILAGLDLAGNTDLLLSEPQEDFKLLYEKKKMRQRVKKAGAGSKQGWTWGEDK